MIAPPKPPSRDDVEALIKEARARQLRRRRLGAAGVAIVAGVGLAVYALTTGGGAQSGLTNGSPRCAAPLCRNSRLSVAATWNGAVGHLLHFFTITNQRAG